MNSELLRKAINTVITRDKIKMSGEDYVAIKTVIDTLYEFEMRLRNPFLNSTVSCVDGLVTLYTWDEVDMERDEIPWTLPMRQYLVIVEYYKLVTTERKDNESV